MIRRLVLVVSCTLFTAVLAASQTGAQPSAEPTFGHRDSTVLYGIDLKGDAAAHLLRISMRLPPGLAQHDLQLPVWNATYQVRDFAQYVNRVQASAGGHPIALRQLDKATWQVNGCAHGCEITYDYTADISGPFGMQFNEHHAFLNLAMVLMYATDLRSNPIALTVSNPSNVWNLASAMDCLTDRAGRAIYFICNPPNYDRMVDSPIELGNFQRVDFDQDGARYSLVVDADPADYDLVAITEMCKKIAATETAWMNDRPFDHYMFIYHFPKPGGGGGMEHVYSTAIDASADRVRGNPLALADVTAHEFFHLWNVKRIRPQSLEPVDYTKEQYSRALWFSEGVTSAVADYVRLRAGFIDEKSFIETLGRAIEQLQLRPAHLTQSVEESSLTTWFDKYSGYHAPERSISYYNKGEILGVLLDLATLEATSGQKSLRDVFHYLNEHYAKQGRFFDDSAGVREAVEAASGASFREFFEKYVAGVDEIPYDDFFKSVGLRLDHRKGTVADAGFIARRNSNDPRTNDPPVVSNVAADGPAEKAGLQVGDNIASINDKPVGRDLAATIAAMKPGDVARVKITRRNSTHELKMTLGSREQDQYLLIDVDNLTAAQRTRRRVWLGTLMGVPQSHAGASAALPGATANFAESSR